MKELENLCNLSSMRVYELPPEVREKYLDGIKGVAADVVFAGPAVNRSNDRDRLQRDYDALKARCEAAEAHAKQLSAEAQAARDGLTDTLLRLEAAERDAARWQFCKKHGYPKPTRAQDGSRLWYMDRASDNVEMVATTYDECVDKAMALSHGQGAGG